MPFPPVPDFPDNDPVEALRMLRNYVRLLLDYFSPLAIAVALLAIAVLLAAFAYYFANLDSLISWGAEFVPMAFAVVGIVFSVKKLREEHHPAVIALLVIVGVLGTVVLHLARTHAEAAHAKEIGDLRSRMDSVRDQNGQLLTALLKPIAPLSSQAAELERRENIKKALRGEYILSHDNVSSGLLAGTELPPADWMNKRLRDVGEKWTVAAPPSRSPSIAPQPQPDAAIVVWLGVGDDSQNAIPIRIDPSAPSSAEMNCIPPFVCYSEDQLKTTRINIDFTAKKTRRLFFAVANISSAIISKADANICLSADDPTTLKGMSLHRPDGRGNISDIAVDYAAGETVDILPFSRTHNQLDFNVDLTADGNITSDASVVFRIYAANLTVRTVVVYFHIQRSG